MVDLTSLADQTVLLSLFIVIVGVGSRTWFGMRGKPKSALNFNLIAMSFIIALPVTLGVVSPQVEAIPDDATPIYLFSTIVGLIMAVVGSDVAVKKVSKAIASSKDREPAVKTQVVIPETNLIPHPQSIPTQKVTDSTSFTARDGSVTGKLNPVKPGETPTAGQGFDARGIPVETRV